MRKPQAASKLERGSSAGQKSNPVGLIVKALNVTFLATPIALISLLIAILAYSFTFSPSIVEKTSRSAASLTSTAKIREPVLQKTATLLELLADVTDALDDANVTHWLLPGIGLLPPKSDKRDGGEGRLNPWQEGIDIGVYQDDLMQVILAQAELQPKGIVPVESYFGLRLFSIYGLEDDRYDFRTPFVDILYFKDDSGHSISFCCDCAPIKVSACTKKTCGCLVCATKLEEVFPLSSIRIDGMRRDVSCPRNKDTLFLPKDIPGVHPALFDM